MKNVNMMLAAAVIATMGSIVNADILTLKPGPNAINGVNIADSAKASIDGNKTVVDLKVVGAGLRQKTVIIATVDVYVAQLMVSDDSRYVHSAGGALPSLDNENSMAIRLTFLRDVDAQTMATALQDGLDANKISAKDPEIKAFMAAFTKGGDVKNTGSMTIYITKNADGSETLAYENQKPGVKMDPIIVPGGKDLHHKILSIWLGNPADAGVGKLKDQLVK